MKYTIESPVYIGQSVWAKHRGRWRKYEVYSIVINADDLHSQFYVKWYADKDNFETRAFPFDQLGVMVFENCPEER